MLLTKNYKRLVVKIGSSLFSAGKGKLDCGLLDNIASSISALAKDGKEVVVVSSGAVAFGMSTLRLESRPRELEELQASAAVGQPQLMEVYRSHLSKHGLHCAQLLLTWDDFDDRGRYLNVKKTILQLFKAGAIPVINENDTVSTDEIKFGDNDRLSALVAVLVAADLLIILSDVDGLLDKDKAVVNVVDKITPQIRGLACPSSKKTCVGGMITKIDAAHIAVDSGIPCVIANGRARNVIISSANDPGSMGTIFLPKQEMLDSKKRWIAFGTKTKGRVIVDAGAKKALINKKSLLSVGVVSCEGGFSSGDIISLMDADGYEFARGKVSLSCAQIDMLKGKRHEKEVVHRDNIVVL